MPKKDFHQVFAGASAEAIDLLEKMLVLDPEQRIDVQASLEHPYLQHYHDPEDEPVADPIDLSFDREEHPLSQVTKIRKE